MDEPDPLEQFQRFLNSDRLASSVRERAEINAKLAFITPHAVTEKLPGSLGQGTFSIGLRPANDGISLANTRPTIKRSDTLDLLYIDTFTSLYHAIGFSSQASFNGFAGRGAGSYSWASQVDFSRLSVYMLLRRRIENISVRVVTPTLTSKAKQELDANPDQFLRLYGDMFVNEVVLGGAVYVLVEFSTQSLVEFQAVRMSAGLETGPVSGSVDFLERIERVRKGTTFSLNAHQIGVTTTPPQRQGSETITAYVTRMFAYMETAANQIYAPGSRTELSIELMPYTSALGSTPDTPTLKQQGEYLQAAHDLKVEINRRIQRINLALLEPQLYQNPDITSWTNNRQSLQNQLTSIERYVGTLFASPEAVTQPPPFSIADLLAPPTPIDIPPVDLIITALGIFGGTPVRAGNGEWAEPTAGPPNLPVVTATGIKRLTVALNPGRQNLGIRVRTWSYFSNGLGGPGPNDGMRYQESDGTELTAFGILGFGSFNALAFELTGTDRDKYLVEYGVQVYDRWIDPPQVRALFGSNGQILGSPNADTLGISSLMLRVIAKATI
ncbi:hypothetical protein [Massilia niabensis]|uniref:MACPF domain-containing protein n=1 Tax=Massilia niabensis TaxID=544910 RepID=A0ABW0L7B6_9BURK